MLSTALSIITALTQASCMMNNSRAALPVSPSQPPILPTFNYLPASVPPLFPVFPSPSLTDSGITQFSVITYPDTSKELYTIINQTPFSLPSIRKMSRKRALPLQRKSLSVTQHKQVHAAAISTLPLHVNGLLRMCLKSYLIDLIMDVREGGGGALSIITLFPFQLSL